VPAFCRLALESACTAVSRRRLLATLSHAETERRLLDAQKLSQRAALALFGDHTRGGEVLTTINRRFGRSAGDTFRTVDKGAHQGWSGNLVGLVEDTDRLARELVRL
jgi:hypothetical protein